MKVLYAGIPEYAKKGLREAINFAYSGLPVEVEAVEPDLLTMTLLESEKNHEIIWVALDRGSISKVEGEIGSLKGYKKVLTYEEDKQFRQLLSDKFGVEPTALPDEDLNISNTAVIDGETLGETLGVGVQSQIIANLQAQLEEQHLLLQYVNMPEEAEVQEVEADNSAETAELKNTVVKLKNSLASREVEISELQGLISEQESRISDTAKKSSVLEETISGFRDEKLVLEREISQLRATLESVRGERDSLESEIEGLVTRGKQKETDLQDAYNALSAKVDSGRDRIRDLEGKLESLSHKNNVLKGKYKELQTNFNSNSQFLREANEEILNLRGQLKGYELSEKGISEQSKKYSDLYEEFLKLKSSFFNRMGSNAFPKTMGTLSLESLSNLNPTLSDIGFLMAGNSESQRNVYKFLREELLLASSGLNTKTGIPFIDKAGESGRTLLVDLSVESSLDYVFEVKGNVKSSLPWWDTGSDIQKYVMNTNIRNVFGMMLGVQFTNEAYLLSVDWQERLTELSNSGYNVIFVGLTLSSLVGRVFMNSLVGFENLVIGMDGLITSTRNSLVNINGFDTSSSTAVVVGKTAPAERLYSILGGKVKEVKYVDLSKR